MQSLNKINLKIERYIFLKCRKKLYILLGALHRGTVAQSGGAEKASVPHLPNHFENLTKICNVVFCARRVREMKEGSENTV